METILLRDKGLSRIVRGALEREREIVNRGITTSLVNLKQYEAKYGISSQEFYQKYLEGKMGDDMDIMLWAAEYQALERLQRDKSRLEGVAIVP